MIGLSEGEEMLPHVRSLASCSQIRLMFRSRAGSGSGPHGADHRFAQTKFIRYRPTLPGGTGCHCPSVVRLSITVPLPILLENHVTASERYCSSAQLYCWS